MKRLITLMVACVLGWSVQAQSACQYWFDADYSTHITINTTTQPIQIDVGNLNSGFHTLYMMFRDSTAVWSQPRTGLFYFPGTIAIEHNDSSYAYWFDANETNLYEGIMSGGLIAMDLHGLSAGFHTLYLRVGGELRNALFYKMPQEDVATNDSIYSYWFDTDSNIRNGTISDSIIVLDVADLSDTNHAVYMMIGKGKSAQLVSGLFQKVPVIYTVTLATPDNTRGSVSGAGDYPSNSTVSISATAEYGYHFSQWSDGDTNALRSILLTKDTFLTAYFVPDTFQFVVTVGDTSMGTVVITGTSEYLGTDTATAIPNYGYHFTGWNDGDTTNPRLVTLTQDTTLAATFAPNIYTVTINTDTPEWGSVLGGGEYPYLSTVSLEAVAIYGYQFKQWNDGVTDNPRQLVVCGDTTLTATFELLRYHLTVNSNDLSRGFTQGGGTFTVMDTATALAITLAGNSFLGWNDGNMDNPRQLQLSCDTTLIAIFQMIDSTSESTIVHDTAYVIVHDTTEVTMVDTLILTEYVPVHDTAYIDVHDTTYLDIPVHDTTIVTDTVTLTEYVPVHDTTYIDVHDTTYINIPVHDTTVVTDTVTLTEYVPVHDTSYIDVHDTTYINIPVHDTTILIDTVTLTQYDTIINTVYDTVTNMVYDTVTNIVYDTTVVDNYIYDTTIVTDTLWLTQYDTIWLTDTIYIHDTIYIPESSIDAVATTNVRLYQRNGQIVVEEADGVMLPEVVVYDAVGRKMESRSAGRAPAYQFDVPASGIYLVKIGDRPARRIVVIR